MDYQVPTGQGAGLMPKGGGMSPRTRPTDASHQLSGPGNCSEAPGQQTSEQACWDLRVAECPGCVLSPSPLQGAGHGQGAGGGEWQPCPAAGPEGPVLQTGTGVRPGLSQIPQPSCQANLERHVMPWRHK